MKATHPKWLSCSCALGALLTLLPPTLRANLTVTSASGTLDVTADNGPTESDTDSDDDNTFVDGLELFASASAALLGDVATSDIDSEATATFSLNQVVIDFTHHHVGEAQGDQPVGYESSLEFLITFLAATDGTLDIDYVLQRDSMMSNQFLSDGFDFTGVQITRINPPDTFGANAFGDGNNTLSDGRSYLVSQGSSVTFRVQSGPNVSQSSGAGLSLDVQLDGLVTFDFTPVPEPGTAGLLALGMAGMLARRRRNCRANYE